MKKLLLILLSFAVVATGYAKGRDIQLKETVNGTYSARSFSGIHPMNDGEHFAKMSSDRKMVLSYSFKNGEVVDKTVGAATKAAFAEKIEALL